MSPEQMVKIQQMEMELSKRDKELFNDELTFEVNVLKRAYHENLGALKTVRTILDILNNKEGQ